MALTEEQEAKLLQLLSAYENGKRVGDLPEVTPGKDGAGLMVEVVDTDGESKKFDLGNVAPVLNITSFGSEQPYGSRRLRRVDRKGNPIWSDRYDPNGYWLSPEEYDGECVPFIAEDGTQVSGANGKLLYIDATLGLQLVQETRAIQAFVPFADFDVSRLKIGLRVSIKDSEGATDSNWSVSEIGEKGFTVRNAEGDNTLQFFYEGEFWVGKGADGIEEGTRLMTLAINEGHFYKFGDAERIEGYDYPYGNDIYDGGRYSFLIGSWLLGNNPERTFVGTFYKGANDAEGWFVGVEDAEGLSIEMPMRKGNDGFWVMSNSGDVGGMLERTRPDTFYSHMIPLQSNCVTSLITEAWSGDLGQAVRGLLNPELEDPLYDVLTTMAGRVPLTMFHIQVMDSEGATHEDRLKLKPIQGGAIDPYSMGSHDHLAVEFYLIASYGQMYFVRLVYSSDYNIIEEESIIPDGVLI